MFRTLATSTIALIAGAAPVFADVTPLQVWESFSEYYNKIGYEVVIGQQDEAGDTLTLSDVVIKAPENDEYSSDIMIPKVTLQQTGDAGVRTVIEGDVTANITTQTPDANDLDISMTMSMPGNEMISSGTPEDLLHEFTYPNMTLDMNVSDPGEKMELPMRVTLTDLAGTQSTKLSDGTESVFDMTAGKLAIGFSADQPPAEDGTEQNGRIEGNFEMADLVAKGRANTPAGDIDPATDMTAALKAGLLVDGSFASGAVTGNFSFSGEDADGQPQEASGSVSAENGELVAKLSKDGMTYNATYGRAETEVNISSLPFPITYAIDGAAGGFTFPVLQSDTAQPFKISYEFSGLTFSDQIWDLFDSARQLPRDPASLSLDLNGTVLMNENPFDPDFGQTLPQTAMGDDDDMTGTDAPQSPVLPQSLNIASLALDAIGVTADVTGDLDFSQNINEPVGTLEGNFTGINGIIDTLISMGIVPQEQAMGARMMLAMFAKPVDDNPDHLRTELEFREGGSIFANGQQVK